MGRRATATKSTGEQSFDYYDGECYVSTSYEHMAKTDDRVKYRAATAQEQTEHTRCYDCRFYGWGLCNLVEGTVEANMRCDLFKPLPELYPMEMHDIAVKDSLIRLAVEQSFTASGTVTPPEWIEYYPAPGRFNHPEYGEIVVTAERNQRMIDNFKNGVYPQTALPIDCDHNLAVSGAVGFIEDMRLTESGSIEAKVQWNSFGETLIGQDRFRYFSPSIVPLWPHTVTGELIPDVAVGGAICNNPYFTEPWLRPLVATMDGGLRSLELKSPQHQTAPKAVRVVELRPDTRTREARTMSDKDRTTNPSPAPAPVQQFSEAEIAAFREFQASGGLAAVAALKEQFSQVEQRNGELVKAARTARFNELINGVETFADGTRKQGPAWAGDRADHVAMLTLIADTKGEESQEFAAYGRQQRASANAIKQGLAFTEIGTPEGVELTGDAEADIEQLVADEMKKSNLDYGAAMSVIAKRHPAQFQAYRRQAARPARELVARS